jgi:hypothetical protein
MTEYLIVSLRSPGVGSPATINDVNPAFPQIAAERLRQQRAECVDCYGLAPNRPREPIVTVEVVEASCTQPALDREARKERQRLTRKEDGRTNRTVLLVLLRELST